jgi:hypothetical protein
MSIDPETLRQLGWSEQLISHVLDRPMYAPMSAPSVGLPSLPSDTVLTSDSIDLRDERPVATQVVYLPNNPR